MKFKKIEINRQGNFIMSLLLIYFVFFGYICNTYKKNIGENLIFLHKILFNVSSFWSFIILFGIVFIMAYREVFFEYAIRNSIWLLPAILIMSWFWYWVIFESFDPTFIIIYFITVDGILTFLGLLFTNLLAAILGSTLKEYRKKRIEI